MGCLETPSKKILRKPPKKKACKKHLEGTILTKRSDILRTWRYCVGELYGENERTDVEIEDADT